MLTPDHEKKLATIMLDLEVCQDEAEFWTRVVEKACQSLHAESGTFFGVAAGAQELKVVASFGILPWRLEMAQFPFDKGICGWAATHRGAVCVNDVAGDTRFNAQVDLVTRFKTRSILCAPVALQDRLYGVLEILNPQDRPFQTADTEFLEALGGSVATLYQKLRFTPSLP